MSSNNGNNRNWQTWMEGRNGIDELTIAVLVAAIVVMVIGFFIGIVNGLVGTIFTWIALAALAYCIFRMTSKNTKAREAEDKKWATFWSKVSGKGQKDYGRFQEWKLYHKDFRLYTCEKCGQNLRVPKGKGKIKVTCPKCKESFIAKS